MTYAQRTQDEFTRGYIACLLWVNEQEPGAEEELGEEALAWILSECANFQGAQNGELFAAYTHFDYREYSAGCDFYLTRNGHGAGFWDRGMGKIGEALTAAAKVYGSTDESFEGADHE